MMRKASSMVCLFATLLIAVGLAHAQTQAGTVVFSTGVAHIITADGGHSVASSGSAVRAGDSIVTEVDAHVHLRMTDNAFVAIRPQSRLRVDLYDFRSERPSASRIKLHLESGVTRTISGKGGEEGKRNYRFNTPLAAIGLRGTDYTVWADSAATRVAVARGAVIVAALGETCVAATLGPCDTPHTRELSASTPHAYLEVNSASRVPVLVRPEQDPAGNRQISPPVKPAEPRAEVSVGNALTLSDVRQTVGQVVAGQLAEAASGHLVVNPPAYQLVWGRWSTYADYAQIGAPPVASLVAGRDVVFGNDMFGLLRDDGTVRLPTEGQVGFRLAGSEAYVVSGKVVSAAQVQGGSFNIDFLNKTFGTELQVRHAGGLEQLRAGGQLTFQGLLVGNDAKSNMGVAGAVGGGGTEAAYLFDKSLSSGNLLGAVRWVR